MRLHCPPFVLLSSHSPETSSLQPRPVLTARGKQREAAGVRLLSLQILCQCGKADERWFSFCSPLYEHRELRMKMPNVWANLFTPTLSFGARHDLSSGWFVHAKFLFRYAATRACPERIPRSGMSRILRRPLGIRRNCSGFDPEFTEGSKGNRRIGAAC